MPLALCGSTWGVPATVAAALVYLLAGADGTAGSGTADAHASERGRGRLATPHAARGAAGHVGSHTRAAPPAAVAAIREASALGGVGPDGTPVTDAAPVALGARIHVGQGTGGPAAPHAPTTRRFGGVRAWSEYVAMSDGVRLAVDVHVPEDLAPGERTATILHLSRYYRSIRLRGLFGAFLRGVYPVVEHDLRTRMVKAGYSWVDADLRGTGASFGRREYPLSAREVEDGRELVAWIVRQPWAAGVVGATGSSYNGTLASRLAHRAPSALKAIAPRFSAWDLYEDAFFPGGLQAVSLIDAWTALTRAFDSGDLAPVARRHERALVGGVRPVDGRLLAQARAEHGPPGDLEGLLDGIMYRDDPPPHHPSLPPLDAVSPHAIVGAQARVPVYAYGGYFDGALARGQIRQFLASEAPGSRLRLGPWFHNGEVNASPYAGGRRETFDHTAEILRFFDYHLRGIANGFGGEPPVHYYTMGEERWRTATTWPPPGAAWRALYFAPERTLAPAAPVAAPAADRYEVDRTVTSGEGSRWGLVVLTGARRGYGDRRARAARLLTYTSAPLDRPLEVTGHPRVHLYLTANAEDGAVFAYLEDVTPDGRVHYVTEGLLRLRHRALAAPLQPGDLTPARTYRRADGRPLAPGTVAEVVFDLLPVSYVFRAGHAVRISIAGADAGTFAVPLPAHPLVYEVRRDAAHPSRVELPTR